MNHYLHSSVANFEVLGKENTKKWLCFILEKEGLGMYLVSSKGLVISCKSPNKEIDNHKENFISGNKRSDKLKHNGIILAYGATGSSAEKYMLISTSATPNWYLGSRNVLSFRLVGVPFISSLLLLLIVYFLVSPLQTIQRVVKEFAEGSFKGRLKITNKRSLEEVTELSESFDWMFEQVQQSLKNKQSLMELISHEIRSPLTRQKLALQLMKKNIEYDKNLNTVSRENANITKLVNEIFSYLSLNQSEIKLKLSRFNLNHVIEDVIDDCNFEFNTTNVRFSSNKEYRINADISLLSIAIQNIIKNALKYSGSDKPINIILSSQGSDLVLECIDNGPGVMIENLKAIFMPFFREQATKNSINGHGLGLALTEKIICLHNGSILCENRQEGGLKVTIRLPMLITQKD